MTTRRAGHYPFGVQVERSGDDFDEKFKAMEVYCSFFTDNGFDTVTVTDRLSGRTYISFQFATREEAAAFRETWVSG